MAIDDIAQKGKKIFEDGKDKVEDAFESDKAEDISDKILDAVSGAAKKVLPQDKHAKIDEVRDNLDKKIGNE